MVVIIYIVGLIAAAVGDPPATDLSTIMSQRAAPTVPSSPGEAIEALNYLVRHRTDFGIVRPGSLNFSEFLDYTWAGYLIWDRNRDGRIDLSEYLAGRCFPVAYGRTTCDDAEQKKVIIAEFDRLDPAHLGYIYKYSIEGTTRRWFDLNDINHDGFVSEAEFTYTSQHNH